MAVAHIEEWRDATPGSENYDAVAAKINAAGSPPEGLIAHTAGRDSKGAWRIVDIWESREHADRFYEERLMPIVREMAQGKDDMAEPDVSETYELHDLVNP